jgi:hypothetical protein
VEPFAVIEVHRGDTAGTSAFTIDVEGEEPMGSKEKVWCTIDRLETAKGRLSFEASVERIPQERMSAEARKFARLLLDYNFQRVRESFGRA